MLPESTRWTETLNTRIENLNESGPSIPEVYHQQLPHVEAWELANPLLASHHFINNDPYCDNHDPNWQSTKIHFVFLARYYL